MSLNWELEIGEKNLSGPTTPPNGRPFSPIPQKPPKALVGTENQGQNGKQLENEFKGFVVDDGVEDEDGESGRGEIGNQRSEGFVFDHTGPYEPLVLLAPGEIPVNWW